MALPPELLERFDKPIEYGVIDCIQFAAAAWEHYTGKNPAVGIEYGSEDEACELIERAGGLDELVSSALGEGFVPSPATVKDIEDGDIALTSFPAMGGMLGVVQVPFLVVLADRGFMLVGFEKLIKVWKCRKPSSPQ